MMAVLKLAVVLLMTWFGIVQAIPTISITGSKFFDSDGKQFYIKGMDARTMLTHLVDADTVSRSRLSVN